MLILAVLMIVAAIIGSGVGIGAGAIIANKRSKNRPVTQYPVPVKMPDGSTKFIAGGGELLLPDLKDRIE